MKLRPTSGEGTVNVVVVDSDLAVRVNGNAATFTVVSKTEIGTPQPINCIFLTVFGSFLGIVSEARFNHRIP